MSSATCAAAKPEAADSATDEHHPKIAQERSVPPVITLLPRGSVGVHTMLSGSTLQNQSHWFKSTKPFEPGPPSPISSVTQQLGDVHLEPHDGANFKISLLTWHTCFTAQYQPLDSASALRFALSLFLLVATPMFRCSLRYASLCLCNFDVPLQVALCDSNLTNDGAIKPRKIASAVNLLGNLARKRPQHISTIVPALMKMETTPPTILETRNSNLNSKLEFELETRKSLNSKLEFELDLSSNSTRLKPISNRAATAARSLPCTDMSPVRT